MSKVVINETTLTAIGDAIRAKTGGTDLIAPGDMPTQISGIETGSGGGEEGYELFHGVVDRSVKKLTAEDLAGVTSLGPYAFAYCQDLTDLTLPDTLTFIDENAFHYGCSSITIPASVATIEARAFAGLGRQFSNGKSITILRDSSVIWVMNTGQVYLNDDITSIYVPGKLLNAYKTHTCWTQHAGIIKPWDEWTGELSKAATALLFGNTETITLSLLGFDYIPEVSITTDAPVTISDINTTMEAVTFTITAQETEGSGTVTIQVTRADGVVIEHTVTVSTWSEFPESTWSVTPLDTTGYTFVLNDAGYYESNNKGQSRTDALCRVDISNAMGKTVIFECINYAETTYDYGRIGNVNQEYAALAADGTYYASFSGKQSASVQEVIHTDAVGDCFVYVSFKKDGSGDKNNDSLQFKVRFED